MQDSMRLRRRNRAIMCRYGVGQREADMVFDLQVKGWTAERVAGFLRVLTEARRLGVTDDEIMALMKGAAG